MPMLSVRGYTNQNRQRALADEKLTAFLELESAIRIFHVTSRWILRTTPVKGQKWLLNDEEPKKETKRERKNKYERQT
jgi:hypothetical protein